MGCRKVLTASLCALGLAVAQAQSTDTMTVHFDVSQSLLRPEDQASIDHRFNAAGRRIRSVELAGYCDSVGENQYNDSLARQRVAMVRKYLLSKGIADSLFTVLYSYGKRKPLNDNGDEEKRSLNRRVTIIWQLGEDPAAGALREAFRDTVGIIGKTIVLQNVLFYRDMHRPMPESYATLQLLFVIMKDHPGLRLEIHGYVCCMPADLDGYDVETHKSDLSARRAEFVYEYLIGRGINANRIGFKGLGGSHRIYPQELNEEQKMRNRRVEIKILGW